MKTIAAIDYGINTGLVIAGAERIDKKMQLYCLFSSTIIYVQEHDIDCIISTTRKFRCSDVILEKFPPDSMNMKAEFVYGKIYFGLLQLGYMNTTPGDPMQLFEPTPGLWKPFMKKQAVDFSTWFPGSVHERDAMRMLWYIICTVYKPEEIMLCPRKNL